MTLVGVLQRAAVGYSWGGVTNTVTKTVTKSLRKCYQTVTKFEVEKG